MTHIIVRYIEFEGDAGHAYHIVAGPEPDSAVVRATIRIVIPGVADQVEDDFVALDCSLASAMAKAERYLDEAHPNRFRKSYSMPEAPPSLN